MSASPLPIIEDDLHGLVDNEVDDDKREAVLAYLANTPADAARVETWRQHNILLRAAFAQVVLEPVPVSLSFAFAPRLIALPSLMPSGGGTRQAHSRRQRRRGFVFSLAAFIAGICIALAANISVSRYAAHVAVVPASTHGPALALLAAAALNAQHATQATAAAANGPGAIEPALAILPFLKAEGLELLRGEIRGTPEDPARCLDFTDAMRRPIVLCVAASDEDTPDEFRALAGVTANSVYWREGASLYALAAPRESARLLTLAHRIHARLPAPPAPAP